MDEHTKSKKFSLIKTLYAYYARYPLLSSIVFLLFSADAIAIIALSMGYKVLIDGLFYKINVSTLTLYLLTLSVIFIFSFILFVIGDYLNLKLAKKIHIKLRQLLFEKIHHIQYQCFEKYTYGTLISFGEIALVYDIPRTASVKTVTPCLLLSLSRTAFQQTIKKFPPLKSTLEKAAQSRLKLWRKTQ
jgi:CRP-like cAMP-binding protein